MDGALRQTGMLYGSLVLKWQCLSEVCRDNNDHTKLLMQPLTADMLAVMLMLMRLHTNTLARFRWELADGSNPKGLI